MDSTVASEWSARVGCIVDARYEHTVKVGVSTCRRGVTLLFTNVIINLTAVRYLTRSLDRLAPSITQSACYWTALCPLSFHPISRFSTPKLSGRKLFVVVARYNCVVR